ncbi:PilN domain-containing protein [Candidatus Omnitrophota bacterium]
MIKINLLPSAARKKEISKKFKAPVIIYFVTMAVVSLHLIFFVLNVYKKAQLGSLEGSCERSQPQFKEIEVLKNNLTIKRDRVKVMEYILSRNIYFTEFFNKINLAIPKGLWLNRLNFSYNSLVIGGSVFSFGTEEISLVNKFFNELKNDQFFLDNFNNFSLDSVQRRIIKEYEVLDFLLTAGIINERFEIEYSNQGER